MFLHFEKKGRKPHVVMKEVLDHRLLLTVITFIIIFLCRIHLIQCIISFLYLSLSYGMSCRDQHLSINLFTLDFPLPLMSSCRRDLMLDTFAVYKICWLCCILTLILLSLLVVYTWLFRRRCITRMFCRISAFSSHDVVEKWSNDFQFISHVLWSSDVFDQRGN